MHIGKQQNKKKKRKGPAIAQTTTKDNTRSAHSSNDASKKKTMYKHGHCDPIKDPSSQNNIFNMAIARHKQLKSNLGFSP
jgi:hypothetical protein